MMTLTVGHFSPVEIKFFSASLREVRFIDLETKILLLQLTAYVVSLTRSIPSKGNVNPNHGNNTTTPTTCADIRVSTH